MFKINASVKVKPGIIDPDHEQFDLGGWQGRISKIGQMEGGECLVTILWDSDTLRTMPKAFVEVSVRNGYSFDEMTLLESEVEAVVARDKVKDRDAAIAALEQATSWYEMGDQEERIHAVEATCENDFDLLDHWLEHLENKVQLPVKALYTGDSSQNLHQGAEILINGFVDADEHYGIIGSAKYQGRRIQVPLCDVEVLESSKKTEALEDYGVWFVNR